MEDSKSDVDICMSDRLIPSRGSCGELGKMKLERDENWAPQNDYHAVLSQNVLGNQSLDTKILSYKHKPRRQQRQNELSVLYTCNREGASKPKPARVVPQTAMKVLDAPGLVDNFYNHPIDWSSKNVIAVALGEAVFLFDATSGRAEKLLTLPEDLTVTSVRWAGEGAHLSVGTSHGDVQIWDGVAQRQLRNLRGHAGRLGALAWHEHVVSSGSTDAEIHHHDVRARDHLVGCLSAHADLICGLDYSADGALASGGNDNVMCIWESAMTRTPLHTLTEHRAAVKAIRWCPWQRHLLASGGGSADRQVCLWSTSTGKLITSTSDAQSQVTGVVWSHQERELLTSHGYSRNQLSLWKYPALVKYPSDLEGHNGRVLGIAQSPDGSLVCSASADETLRFWRVFSPTSEKQRQGNCDAPNRILKTIR
uniref:CDC20/Fizzy WD40 domain-containing protein n=1 Tax=Noctiluca scintillans TaxID=2966 RepID=A0A7S0ZZ97_NOCSC